MAKKTEESAEPQAEAANQPKGYFPGILGTKLGMTQFFDDDGVLQSVTVVKAGPCVVVQRKATEPDGYAALQIGLVEESRQGKRSNKPMAGHFKKSGQAPTRVLKELRLGSDEEGAELEVGAQITAGRLSPGDRVDVIGRSKGKGFQGVMKRHGFGGGRATHGSMFHRAPGSIGASAYPSRVYKGTRLPGQTGSKRITVKNLPILRVDADSDLVFIRGSVPGAPKDVVLLRPSRGGKR